ncbi:hypothetical protein [Nonomuraea sp. NPDC050786]|uniref:hypothetical protein n=1 Tax=Nonomuraea sp. NPDC050786 TaxID=3154840 RepID=UPI0033C77B20
MTAPHNCAHLADRVQRLEAWAVTVDGDIANTKAKLPAMIREEILNYTEPVFGEIMAGNATLATKEHLNALERRLTDRMDTRFQAVDAKFDQVDARFDQMEKRFEKRFESVDARLDQMDKRFESVDARLDQMDKRFGSVDVKLDKILAALGMAGG